MPKIDRRDFLKVMGLGAAAGAAPLVANRVMAGTKMPDGFYDAPLRGSVRILHITDVHGQLRPVYFREPNVNIGVGPAMGRPKTGMFKTADLVGLDVVYAARMQIFERTGDARFKPPKLVKTLVDKGRLGRKTGRGFLEY